MIGSGEENFTRGSSRPLSKILSPVRKTALLSVTACNRNGLDLQSSSFSTGIDYVYPAPRTSIDCKRTCIQPLRPAIERNRPGLNATEKPMI
ncbi:hypothetical protein DND67_23530 [Pseudomonas syringae pv. pisi]|nr:hypothetical protein DND67_23530 [Pseudomonas syringae pv. pisi]